MDSCQDMLERAAKDGSIEPADWSRFFDTILSRLEQNVHRGFIIPVIPETSTPPTSRQQPSSPPKAQISNPSSTDSHTSQAPNKENAPPSSPPPSAPQGPSTPHASLPSYNSGNVLPGPLLTTWTYIRTTLTKQFSTYPPHTVQRLSELTLRPHQHYRYLPAYLNALDRVVSVSSGSNAFPLPAVELGPGSSLANGTAMASTFASSSSLDSDESLGGALLTPIPWLRNGSGSAPSSPMRHTNGEHERQADPGAIAADSDEDVTMTTPELAMRENGAVTQGELMRQQQEAGDAPTHVSAVEHRQHVVSMPAAAGEGEGESGEAGESEIPHARGPERIGLEDTGPRPLDSGSGMGQALDMEAAVGRGPSVHASGESMQGVEAKASDTAPDNTSEKDVTRGSDDDVEITDVDGLTDEEKQAMDVSGDNSAPDAVDATAR